MLANEIKTEFKITLADNAVVMERKTKELELEAIKRQSVVRVEIEHRDIDVGEPFKTEYPSNINLFFFNNLYLYFFDVGEDQEGG